eukprot:scaffold13535_cov114-Isochrysis_galbana.AAC.6
MADSTPFGRPAPHSSVRIGSCTVTAARRRGPSHALVMGAGGSRGLGSIVREKLRSKIGVEQVEPELAFDRRRGALRPPQRPPLARREIPRSCDLGAPTEIEQGEPRASKHSISLKF